MDINASSISESLAISLTLQWKILRSFLFLYTKTNIVWTLNFFNSLSNCSKYQFLINGRGKSGIKTLKNPKVQKHLLIINKIADVYENLEDYNPIKKRWLLIAFDDRTVDIESNNKLSPIVTELFLIGKKT